MNIITKCYKMQVMDKLIKQLEKYRLEKRVSQEDLAGKLGVAFSTVNRWINRKTNPNKTQRFHINKLLKRNRKVRA